MIINGHLVQAVVQVVPLVTLVLGIGGAVLVTRSAIKDPKRKNWLGLASLAVAVLLELSLIVFQSSVLRIS